MTIRILSILQLKKTGFVTQIKDYASCRSFEKLDIGQQIHNDVFEDKTIEIDVKKGKETSKLRLTKVTFYNRANKREFEFLMNLFELRANLIAAIYKTKWQIEQLFKQLNRISH